MVTETASAFIIRNSAEWERQRARGTLIRMKDVNREAVHLHRRDAWTFLAQSTYAEAVTVLERLTHLQTIGIPAVPLKLPAAEYRLSYFIVGRIGRASGKWTWDQFSPIMSAGDLERIVEKARAEGTLLDHLTPGWRHTKVSRPDEPPHRDYEIRTGREGWRSPARLTQGHPRQSTPVTVSAGHCGQPAEGYREGTPSASGWARR